jgi:hypothetical protein
MTSEAPGPRDPAIDTNLRADRDGDVQRAARPLRVLLACQAQDLLVVPECFCHMGLRAPGAAFPVTRRPSLKSRDPELDVRGGARVREHRLSGGNQFLGVVRRRHLVMLPSMNETAALARKRH